MEFTEKEKLFVEENFLKLSHEEIGKEIGKTRGSIRNYCWRKRLRKKEPLLTLEEKEKIRVHYQDRKGKPIYLKKLAGEMGRDYTGICALARKMGLTSHCREKSNEQLEIMAKNKNKWYETHEHSRGMLGKHQGQKAKDAVGEASKRRWEKMTKTESIERSEKIMRTRIKNGTFINPRINSTWKQSWENIGGKRKFYRSRWEANYARYLEWLKTLGEIKDWEHEPETFWFEKIKRGTRTYTPDFKVTEKDGSIIFHEVKGWMDSRSITKIKRMRIYHPEIKLKVIDSSSYKALQKSVSMIVPGWIKS